MSRTFDVVFQGGGAKGLVLNGAMERLEARGYTTRRLVGTSAGAIAACLAAGGYSGKELADMCHDKTPEGYPAFAEYIADPPIRAAIDVKQSGLFAILVAAERSLHIPEGIAARIASHLSDWLAKVPGVKSTYSFIEQGGVHTGNGFVVWLERMLEKKGAGTSKLTFEELFKKTGRHLTLVATDTTSARMIVMNHHTTPDLPVVSAARMSMSIPLFFEEIVWQKEWGTYLGEDITGHVVVDGGVLSNFPIRFILPDAAEYVSTFMGKHEEGAMPLGLRIAGELEVPGAPDSDHSSSGSVFDKIQHTRVAQRIFHLVETMLDGNDDTIEQAHREVICDLPAKGYFATEFHMTDARIDALVNAGRKYMDAYLDKLEATR